MPKVGPLLVVVLLFPAGRGGAGGEVEMITAPPGAGSMTPRFARAEGGPLLLSWLEEKGDGHALLFSSRTETGWTEPREVARGSDWFINWADFPSLCVLDAAGKSLAAHWLRKVGPGTYAYEVRIAFSSDGGGTWGESLVPHDDATATEHGFVSLVPGGEGRLLAFWLDGRNFAAVEEEGEVGETAGDGHGHGSPSREMTLRCAEIEPTGRIVSGAVLDDRVCECCQTSAVATGSGSVVVYRDRSKGEVRDISFVRRSGEGRTEPRLLHPDGWATRACPVNGPAIAARGDRVAVAWFTISGELPTVKVAFSSDGGRTFGSPVRVDDGKALGRADVVVLEDGSALVSWMGYGAEDGEILLRRIHPGGRRDPSLHIANASTARAAGFPRIALGKGEILCAFTDAGDETRVRVARIAVPRCD